MFVFRKKKHPYLPQSEANLYQQNEDSFEFENSDGLKSRFSCDRCRKYKKKCSRDLPECEYCASSEELCRYRSRKKAYKRQRKDFTTSNSKDVVCQEPHQTAKDHKTEQDETPHNLEAPTKQSSTIYQLLN